MANNTGGDDDVLGCVFFIIALPIVIIVWMIKAIIKIFSNKKSRRSKGDAEASGAPDDNEFPWLSGESDELTLDEIINIEELLED